MFHFLKHLVSGLVLFMNLTATCIDFFVTKKTTSSLQSFPATSTKKVWQEKQSLTNRAGNKSPISDLILPFCWRSDSCGFQRVLLQHQESNGSTERIPQLRKHGRYSRCRVWQEWVWSGTLPCPGYFWFRHSDHPAVSCCQPDLCCWGAGSEGKIE